MNAVVYLFQVSACMGIFYLFYYALLCRYTFFTINRWYLIITLAICFVIPLLTITVPQQQAYPQVIQQVVYINKMQVPKNVVIANEAPEHLQINWIVLARLVYLAAVGVLLLRLFLMVMKFFNRVKNKKRTKIGGVHIVKGDETLSNGSFFNYIFLSDDELNYEELQQIIAHEMLHVKLYHSVDRILVKVAQVFLWFNPFVYLYARAIEENHEFEVDRAVSTSADRNKYAELLFHLSVARQGTLYHNFSMVPLKKRITMLFTKPSHKMKKVIYLLAVPLVLISCLAFAKLKGDGFDKAKEPAAFDFAETAKVKYRQKTKRMAAQIKADDERQAKAMAYMASPEGKQKMALAQSIFSKVITVNVLDDYKNKDGEFRGKIVKDKTSGTEFLLLTWYGQEKQLNNQLKKGDEINIKVFGGGVNQDRRITISPTYVIKDGKEIFRLVEAEKIPDYPFLYEANKVRFAEGQISNINKYPNGKWKTAVFERVNGYKFNLSFKPNAPDLNSIKWGDHVTLRFVHEVKSGAKTYNIKDWVAISTDIKDYGIKNTEWFNKFYDVVKADTGKVSAIQGVERLGANPLVLINGKEYPKEILYQISGRGIRGSSMYPPNNGTTKYGDKAKDGAIVIETRDGEINYLTDTEKENLLKLQAAKGKFFSRVTLIKEDGSKYDMATLSRASGSRASADLATNGKIAFIINSEVYNEAQFKRLFKTDKAIYGPSIGVGGASKELKDKGFKLDGYDLVFEFNPGANSKVTSTPLKTGALAPGKKANSATETNKGITVNKPPRTLYTFKQAQPLVIGFSSQMTRFTPDGKAIFKGGQSNYRGAPAGLGLRNYKNFTTEPLPEETKKSGEETIPAAKDTVGNRKRALNEAMANLPDYEVRADGTAWFKGQRVNRIMIDGVEFIPTEIKEKVGNTKILVDGKEFIPKNIDIKKGSFNSVSKLKTDYKKPNDSLVAARFSGKVTTVKDIMGTQLIIIRNGDYFAAYSNLKSVNVSSGQEIKAGQLLGLAAFNPKENKVAAHFELYRRQNLITDKTEQETILQNFDLPKLNMVTGFKNMYAYTLPKTNKPL